MPLFDEFGYKKIKAAFLIFLGFLLNLNINLSFSSVSIAGFE